MTSERIETMRKVISDEVPHCRVTAGQCAPGVTFRINGICADVVGCDVRFSVAESDIKKITYLDLAFRLGRRACELFRKRSEPA